MIFLPQDIIADQISKTKQFCPDSTKVAVTVDQSTQPQQVPCTLNKKHSSQTEDKIHKLESQSSADDSPGECDDDEADEDDDEWFGPSLIFFLVCPTVILIYYCMCMHNYPPAIFLSLFKHIKIFTIKFRVPDDDNEELEQPASKPDDSIPFGRKFIVFESELVKLFELCPQCTKPSLPVVKHTQGTMVVIEAECALGHRRTWKSQPTHGTMPWGNLLCAAGILLTGSNPARALNFLSHIGIMSISQRTYNLIQKLYLIPSVFNVWNKHQQALFKQLEGKDLVLGGDARCDSPGHSAKYGTYHLVELTTRKVVCMELIQVCLWNLNKATVFFISLVY